MGKSSKFKGHKTSRPYNPRNAHVYKSVTESLNFSVRKHPFSTSDTFTRDSVPKHVLGHLSSEPSGIPISKTLVQFEKQDTSLLEGNCGMMQQQDEQPAQPQEVLNEANEEGVENEPVGDDQPSSQEDPATDNNVPDHPVLTTEAQENMTEDNLEAIDIAKGKSPKKSTEEVPEISGENEVKSPNDNEVKFSNDNDQDRNNTVESTNEISLDEKVTRVNEKSVSVNEDVGALKKAPEEHINGIDDEASESDIADEYYKEELVESEGNLDGEADRVSEGNLDGGSDHVSEDNEALPANSDHTVKENGVEEDDEPESFGEKCMPESGWDTSSESESKYGEETQRKPEPEPAMVSSYTISRDPSRSIAGNIRSISSRRPVRNLLSSVHECSVERGSVSSRTSDTSHASQSSLPGSSKDDIVLTDSDCSMERHEEKTNVPVKRKADEPVKTETKKKKLESPSYSYNLFSLVSSPLQSFGSKIRNGIPSVRAAVNGDQKESEDKTAEKTRASTITEKAVPADTPETSTQNKQSYKNWCTLM